MHPTDSELGQAVAGYPWSAGYPLPRTGSLPTPPPPPITDRELVAVANVLLDYRHGPSGEIELASRIIDALAAARNQR